MLGERYLPLEETAVERIIADIAEKRPSFILNNLIGPSSYAFLAAMRELGERDPAFLPENCPSPAATCRNANSKTSRRRRRRRQLCAASYFDSLETAENRAFKTPCKAGAEERIGVQRLRQRLHRHQPLHRRDRSGRRR